MRGVIVADTAVTNDYAPVNQGQVKWIAAKAYEELNTLLPGGAGPALDALVGSFSDSNNYQAVNLGQLKNVARPFYDRLIALGLAAGYPWTSGTADDEDFAPANVGQVKNLFAFDVRGDADGDGLPDLWEARYFKNLNVKSNADPDKDGLTNLQEYQIGTDPTLADTDGDGINDGDEIRLGSDPLNPPREVIRFVSLTGGHIAPYTNWGMAARDIQTAIDAAQAGEIVLVRDGTYAEGGMTWGGGILSNRVVIEKAITVRSVMGPEGATIKGGTGMRCAYVGESAILSGFTLSHGETLGAAGDVIRDRSGGGAWCEAGGAISNCIVWNNTANGYGGGIYGGKALNCVVEKNRSWRGSGAAYSLVADSTVRDNAGQKNSWGGGVYECRVERSRIAGNTAYERGGGAYGGELWNSWLEGNETIVSGSAGGGCVAGVLWNCVIRDNKGGYAGGAWLCRLYNCTVAGNTADTGTGGAYDCEVHNSIVYYNRIGTKKGGSPHDYYGGSIRWSCTQPLAPGFGNITNAPGFEDNTAGDYRLRWDSPCVDAGTNMAWMIPGETGALDVTGATRVRNNRVDALTTR